MTANDETATTQELTDHIEALLRPLGGRYAVSARRLANTRKANKASQEHIALSADEVFPAASLVKLCIAVELLRRVSLGQFDMQERCDTSQETRVGGGGIVDYLNTTTQLTLQDLCLLMIALSDNTAANFLLDLVGMGEVNETMRRLSLVQTKLARHFMDFAARAAHHDNVTSANEVTSLLLLVHGNAVPGAAQLREMLAVQQCADDLRAWLPEQAQLSHKTGALDNSGAGDGVSHDAGLLSGPSGTCVFCILTAEQQDIPAARYAVGHVLHELWERWCQ